MRHFLRHLPLLAMAACATPPGGHPRMLAAAGIGCEREEYGTDARAIAIYTRVVTDRVCTVDAAGKCHPHVNGGAVGAEVRLPSNRSASAANALRQELGRRGILARIARPRGPKMYASLGADHRDDALLVLELSDIAMSEAGDIAYVTVRTSGALEAGRWPIEPGGELVRLTRTLDVAEKGASRHTSPVRACWRPEHSGSRALAD